MLVSLLAEAASHAHCMVPSLEHAVQCNEVQGVARKTLVWLDFRYEWLLASPVQLHKQGI
jgi:hypothetical protein